MLGISRIKSQGKYSAIVNKSADLTKGEHNKPKKTDT